MGKGPRCGVEGGECGVEGGEWGVEGGECGEIAQDKKLDLLIIIEIS